MSDIMTVLKVWELKGQGKGRGEGIEGWKTGAETEEKKRRLGKRNGLERRKRRWGMMNS